VDKETWDRWMREAAYHHRIREILGDDAVFSTLINMVEPTVILQVKLSEGEVLRFEEPIEVFPSEKLLAQLMLIAP
jgi:hypothetical protein